MFEFIKRLFGGAPKEPKEPKEQWSTLVATAEDGKPWASFEVDPGLAYHCREQSLAPISAIVPGPTPPTLTESVVAVTVDPVPAFLVTPEIETEIEFPGIVMFESPLTDPEQNPDSDLSISPPLLVVDTQVKVAKPRIKWTPNLRQQFSQESVRDEVSTSSS